jgi:Kef-type K+ transport system membrane component KefB/Trk K+ transport system NAD-binding subunit
MEPNVDFYPLLVVSVLAVAVPVLLHRMPRVSVPIIVGEIIAGMVVGPNGLGLITGATPHLDFLMLFGFAYLMFLAGLEIDFGLLLEGPRMENGRAVYRMLSSPLGAGLMSFAVTLGVALAFSFLLFRWGLVANVFIMALVLSTTSLGVVAPVLRQHRLVRSELGQYILVAAVVGDLATVTLVSGYVILHTQGLTFEILLILGLLAATVLVYRVAKVSQRHLPLEELVDELSHATAQIDTRGALALAVVFIALAQGLGIEVILGAFLAGAIVSLLSAEEGSVVRPKLHALGYGFFIPIFFIMVGVGFDLQALLEVPRGLLLVPVLIGMAFGTKYVAALIYRPLFSWREVLALGTLTSSRLSLIVAVAAVGVEIGAISTATNSAIILVAIVTVVVSPILFVRIVEPVEEKVHRVVIAGSTPHARLLAQRLQQHGDAVTVITRRDQMYEEIREMGIDARLVGEHGRSEDLDAASLEDARTVVSMLADPAEGLKLTRRAKRRYGVTNVIAYVQNPQDAERFQEEGIEVVDPSLSTVIMLEAMVRHPRAFHLVAELDLEREVADVVMTRRALEGRRLREVQLPGDALVLIVFRDDEVIIPRGHTNLQLGDVLTIVGSADAVDEAADYLTVP